MPVPSMPTVTLSNGVTVGNFNASDNIYFADGSVLSGCSKERLEFLTLRTKTYDHEQRDTKFTTLRIYTCCIPDNVMDAIQNVNQVGVDIALVDGDLYQCLRSQLGNGFGMKEDRSTTRFRVIPPYDRFPQFYTVDKRLSTSHFYLPH